MIRPGRIAVLFLILAWTFPVQAATTPATAVRAEVLRQLPARARQDYALARLPRVDI